MSGPDRLKKASFDHPETTKRVGAALCQLLAAHSDAARRGNFPWSVSEVPFCCQTLVFGDS
jgi:hypothetical protein